jgi:hypothetical protein
MCTLITKLAGVSERRPNFDSSIDFWKRIEQSLLSSFTFIYILQVFYIFANFELRDCRQ